MDNPEEIRIDEARKLLKDLQALLPSGLYISEISVTAKIPYKAYSWCGAILHRSFELGQCSIQLYDLNKLVASTIIARGLMETSGMLFWMVRRIENTVKEQTLGDIDKLFMRGKMGYKDWEKMPEALNALSAIDRVDKMFKGYRKVDDTLSEFAHPNWSGTFGAFGINVPNTMRVEFGPNLRGLSWAFIPASLSLSLMTSLYSYEKFREIFSDFTTLCEKELEIRKT